MPDIKPRNMPLEMLCCMSMIQNRSGMTNQEMR